MKKQLSKLVKDTFLIDYWYEEIKELEKSNNILRVADFDYTIFSRDMQLEEEEGLSDNRGEKGPKFIINQIGIKKFIEKYYLNKDFPKDILSKLDKKNDLILTAGIYEFQLAKLVACKLDEYNYIITKDAKEKIIALIRYIIYKLKYIPKKIVIYEDRPEFFVEYKKFIENLLGTKLEVYFVEMDKNKGYNKIELI